MYISSLKMYISSLEMYISKLEIELFTAFKRVFDGIGRFLCLQS